MNVQELKKTANQVRKNIVTAVYYDKAGHPGGSLSAADIYTYLYMEEMNIDPAEPTGTIEFGMTDSCHFVRIVHIVIKDCRQSVWLSAIFYFW